MIIYFVIEQNKKITEEEVHFKTLREAYYYRIKQRDYRKKIHFRRLPKEYCYWAKQKDLQEEDALQKTPGGVK